MAIQLEKILSELQCAIIQGENDNNGMIRCDVVFDDEDIMTIIDESNPPSCVCPGKIEDEGTEESIEKGEKTAELLGVPYVCFCISRRVGKIFTGKN